MWPFFMHGSLQLPLCFERLQTVGFLRAARSPDLVKHVINNIWWLVSGSPDSIDPPNQPDESVSFSYYRGRNENDKRFWWPHIHFFFFLKLGRPVFGLRLFIKTSTKTSMPKPHISRTQPQPLRQPDGLWCHSQPTHTKLTIPSTQHTPWREKLNLIHSFGPRS